MSFGEYLRALRNRTGEALPHLCRRLGIRPATWEAYESGARLPQRKEVEYLAFELGLPLHSSEWWRLHDLHDIARGRIPPDIAGHLALAAAFGALRRRPESAIELDRFLQRLRGVTDELPRQEKRLVLKPHPRGA